MEWHPKRKLEDAADTLTIIDTTEMKEREVWVKLRALLEIIAGKDAASMLWQISPSRRSDQCSTREHNDGGIGDAVPMRSFRYKPDAAHGITGVGFNSSWGISWQLDYFGHFL